VASKLAKDKSVNKIKVETIQLIFLVSEPVVESIEKSVPSPEPINVEKDDFLRITIGNAAFEVRPDFDPEFVNNVVKALSVL